VFRLRLKKKKKKKKKRKKKRKKERYQFADGVLSSCFGWRLTEKGHPKDRGEKRPFCPGRSGQPTVAGDARIYDVAVLGRFRRCESKSLKKEEGGAKNGYREGAGIIGGNDAELLCHNIGAVGNTKRGKKGGLGGGGSGIMQF